MPKRKITQDSYSYDDDEDYVPSKSVKYSALDNVPGKVKAHTLDSDEEDEDHDADNGSGDKSSNILHENDIEGQEDPTIAFEGETTITPFNMKEEMEDGHFDGEGFYHFKKESEQIKDAWLDDIDWVKVKHVEDTKNKYGSDDESDGEDQEANQSSEPDGSDTKKELVIYEKMLEYLKPEETVQKALKRLGGGKKLTSAQKWKLKKQQQQGNQSTAQEGEDMPAMLRLTELANKIVELGNMDVYQETHEMISNKLKKATHTEPAMDMFAETSEAEKAGEAALGVSCVDEVRWQLRWENNDEATVEGPYSSSQLVKWQETGYLSKGAYVRKMGKNDSAWYHTNRIDFELYL